MIIYCHVLNQTIWLQLRRASLEPTGFELGISQSEFDRAAIWANSPHWCSIVWHMYFCIFLLKFYRSKFWAVKFEPFCHVRRSEPVFFSRPSLTFAAMLSLLVFPRPSLTFATLITATCRRRWMERGCVIVNQIPKKMTRYKWRRFSSIHNCRISAFYCTYVLSL